MAMSRQNCLLLILILSMQACNLDARKLRVAMLPAVVSNLHSNDPLAPHGTDATTATSDNGDPTNTIPPSNKPPSCIPHQHQLKSYNNLYNSNSLNILYYVLKAVETEKNRTEPVITEEDNATIANITDKTRFVPAGMEPANKVVCAKLLQELDAESRLFSKTALCAWDYICDYRADRYPHYLFKARCKTAKCNVGCGQSKHNMCQSHGIHVTVLEKKECNEWVWAQEILALACTCTSESAMQAENGIPV